MLLQKIVYTEFVRVLTNENLVTLDKVEYSMLRLKIRETNEIRFLKIKTIYLVDSSEYE